MPEYVDRQCKRNRPGSGEHSNFSKLRTLKRCDVNHMCAPHSSVRFTLRPSDKEGPRAWLAVSHFVTDVHTDFNPDRPRYICLSSRYPGQHVCVGDFARNARTNLHPVTRQDCAKLTTAVIIFSLPRRVGHVYGTFSAGRLAASAPTPSNVQFRSSNPFSRRGTRSARRPPSSSLLPRIQFTHDTHDAVHAVGFLMGGGVLCGVLCVCYSMLRCAVCCEFVSALPVYSLANESLHNSS